MSKHTPGPWVWIEGEYLADMLRLVGQGDEVCNFGNCEQYYPTEGSEPSKADQSLIAAAPDLLEVLKAYVADHDEDVAALHEDARMSGSPHPCDCDLCNAARAAIQKVEGTPSDSTS